MSKLYKSQDRMLFGVCGGLAEYLGIDKTVLRFLFILGAIFTGSILFWVYLALALIMPSKE